MRDPVEVSWKSGALFEFLKYRQRGVVGDMFSHCVDISNCVYCPDWRGNTSISARESVNSHIVGDIFSDQKTLFISSSAFRTLESYKKFNKNEIIFAFVKNHQTEFICGQKKARKSKCLFSISVFWFEGSPGGISTYQGSPVP